MLGLTLALVPNLILPVFGFPEVTDVWVRLLGLSFFLISWIYYLAIKENWISFYTLSAWARITVSLFILACVMLGIAPWPLVLFGIIDAASAIWTYRSVRCGNHATT